MTDRHSFARIAEVAPMPNLIRVQRDSFDWFLKEGLKELFAEISPVQDSTGCNTDVACGADPRRRSDGNDARRADLSRT
jgi:DNA-directed RNA polymerase beta subunit